MKNLILVFLLVLHSATISAQINKDSLWVIWRDVSRPTVTRLEALEAIKKVGTNPDTTFHYTQLQYDLAKTNDLKSWMGKTLLSQGRFFYNKNDYEKASECYTQSLSIAEEIGDKELIANNSYNIGIGYLKKGSFAHGFPLFNQAARIFEELGNKKDQATALEKIAFLYAQQSDLKSSNEYLYQSLAIRQELIKTNDGAWEKFVIAGMEQTLKIQEVKLSSQSDSLEKSKVDNVVKLARDSLFSLAEAFEATLKQRKQESTDESLNQFIPSTNETETKPLFINLSSLIRRAQAYFEQKDTSKAIPLLEEALAMSQQAGELNSTEYTSNILYLSYKATGQYRKSLNMLELSVALHDSLNNMENTKNAIQQKVQSDYEKQKALDDVENEKRVAIEMQKKEYLQNLSATIGVGLLLVLLLAFALWNRNKFIRKSNAELALAKDQAIKSEQYKEQFLANMSHEIRTPMHAILGMVNILERNEHPRSQDVFLNAMHTSANNLVVILNDVLDLSKIEAGKLDIESIPMHPVAVLKNVTQILRYKAEEKGLTMTSQVADDVPPVVMGDPTRLNQILINLAGNAIKFTEKGHVHICLTKVDGLLRFSIKDTGIGIPKDRLELIFSAFEQAKGSTARQYGGTGLGLSISKQLTELQQGKIWVESEAGKGSTFFVELPIIAAAADAAEKDHITGDRLKTMAASLKGISILLAEDNPFNQMIAREDLAFYIEDLKIDTVENGVLAVAKFETGAYDLILMDVQMPEMNGFEAARTIRELERLERRKKAIPIIAMTASLLKSEVDNCYEAGMDNYIPKPYKPNQLIGPIFKELKGQKDDFS